ncbi:MAG: hypothetical protein QGF67_01415 [Lentisphaeria bacterium]|jgi:hypothetical protein|nr:hypothetical protein [Lentisphaeria bacterium]MDP7740070.1 hypothetical protein [Lentisphaeria bacterium]
MSQILKSRPYRRTCRHAAASALALALLLCGCGSGQKQTIESLDERVENLTVDLIGVWEERPRYGVTGKQKFVVLDLQEGGIGTISVKVGIVGLDGQMEADAPEMTGNVMWSIEDGELYTFFADWQATIPDVIVSGGVDRIIAASGDFFIVYGGGEAGITARYRHDAHNTVVPLETKQLPLAENFIMAGDRSFQVSPEDSIHMAGNPAVLRWVDPVTDSADYLVGQHIEYFKPGGFFVVTGGATIVQGEKWTSDERVNSNFVLFADLRTVIERQAESVVRKRAGRELTFGRDIIVGDE